MILLNRVYNKKYLKYYNELRNNPSKNRKWTLYTIMYLVFTFCGFIGLNYVKILVLGENYFPK
jgi:hypothetical protein